MPHEKRVANLPKLVLGTSNFLVRCWVASEWVDVALAKSVHAYFSQAALAPQNHWEWAHGARDWTNILFIHYLQVVLSACRHRKCHWPVEVRRPLIIISSSAIAAASVC